MGLILGYYFKRFPIIFWISDILITLVVKCGFYVFFSKITTSNPSTEQPYQFSFRFASFKILSKKSKDFNGECMPVPISMICDY